MRKSVNSATIAPMEALLVDQLPAGDEWQYEPKWDGFRCLAFRRREIELQSKSEKPLTRYFPEIVAALQKVKAKRFILDGELAVQSEGHFDFDALLQRIHPAASRVQKLSIETPATYIVFDLLEDDLGKSLLEMPLAKRRPQLESFFQKYLSKNTTFALSPAMTDAAQAQAWCNSSLGNVDGIIAKRLDLRYCSGDRAGMQKFKWKRTADCVVGGFRYGTDSDEVGSLLLGLYDDDGRLHHVGFCSGIAATNKLVLTRKLEKLIRPPGFTGRAPGGPSRWSTERSAAWQPLKPALIAEVQFDHVSGQRFRHGTKFLRWRPDKKPTQCTMTQLDPAYRPGDIKWK
jgi:ATP-dependent DNA ligase